MYRPQWDETIAGAWAHACLVSLDERWEDMTAPEIHSASADCRCEVPSRSSNRFTLSVASEINYV